MMSKLDMGHKERKTEPFILKVLIAGRLFIRQLSPPIGQVNKTPTNISWLGIERTAVG